MFIDKTTSRTELELAILIEPGLYECFDEQRFLNSKYSDDELRQVISDWIAEGDECARA